MSRHAEPPRQAAGRIYQSGEWETLRPRSAPAARDYTPEWDAYSADGDDGYLQEPGYYEDPPDRDGWNAPSGRQRTLPSGRQVPVRQPSRSPMAALREYLPAQEDAPRRGTKRRMLGAAALGGVLALVGERLIGFFGMASAKAGTDAGMADNTNAGGGTGGMATPSGSGPAAATLAGVVLGTTAEVPVGGAKIFTAHKVVVSQPTVGQYLAYSVVCTHAGCLLDQVRGGRVYCPCHGGVFNLKDGSVAAGPPPKPLPAKKVTVQGNQIVLTA